MSKWTFFIFWAGICLYFPLLLYASSLFSSESEGQTDEKEQNLKSQESLQVVINKLKPLISIEDDFPFISSTYLESLQQKITASATLTDMLQVAEQLKDLKIRLKLRPQIINLRQQIADNKSIIPELPFEKSQKNLGRLLANIESSDDIKKAPVKFQKYLLDWYSFASKKDIATKELESQVKKMNEKTAREIENISNPGLIGEEPVEQQPGLNIPHKKKSDVVQEPLGSTVLSGESHLASKASNVSGKDLSKMCESVFDFLMKKFQSDMCGMCLSELLNDAMSKCLLAIKSYPTSSSESSHDVGGSKNSLKQFTDRFDKILDALEPSKHKDLEITVNIVEKSLKDLHDLIVEITKGEYLLKPYNHLSCQNCSFSDQINSILKSSNTSKISKLRAQDQPPPNISNLGDIADFTGQLSQTNIAGSKSGTTLSKDAIENLKNEINITSKLLHSISTGQFEYHKKELNDLSNRLLNEDASSINFNDIERKLNLIKVGIKFKLDHNIITLRI